MLAGAFSPHAALAESYAERLGAAPPGPGGLEVQWATAGDQAVRFETTSITDEDVWTEGKKRWPVPTRPIGGYVGEIRVRARAGEALRLPLRIEFSYSQILTADLLPPPPERISHTGEAPLAWPASQRLLDPSSPLRAVRFSESVLATRAAADGTVALPLLLPRMRQTFGPWGNHQPILSCRCEVLDGQGRPLARALPIEVFHAGRASYGASAPGWVTDETEADRALRELAGVKEIVTMPALPALDVPYSEVAAVWVSRREWEARPLAPALLRRLLLMGVWIYGREPTAKAMRESAGVPGFGPVLTGGIGTLTNLSFQAQHPSSYGSGRSLLPTDIAWTCGPGRTREPSALENDTDLFGPRKYGFAAWTVGVLVVFGLAAVIGLPISFFALKGARRLALWWAVPAAAVLVGAIGWFGGRALLPRDAQADVTEYRFGYGGWPEVYCQSVNRSLTFDQRQFGWRLPGGSYVVPVESWSAGSQGNARAMAEEEDGVVLTLLDRARGIATAEETARFAALPLPVALARDGGRPVLKALQPLRHIHVWAGGRWHPVNDLAAGQEVNPLESWTNVLTRAELSGNRVPGLPQRLASLFRRESSAAFPYPGSGYVPPEDLPSPDKTREPGQEPFADSWLVVGVGKEQPSARPAAAAAAATARVIWVVQLPLGGAGIATGAESDGAAAGGGEEE